jgi:hypothetical protein
MTTEQTNREVRVYPAKGRIGLQAAACLAGGILFLLMLVVMFLLALAAGPRRNSGPDFMPGMIGGLSVIGIGLIGRGIFLLKSLQRVWLDENGVHLEGFIGRSTLRWRDIERLERDKQNSVMGTTTNVLKIFGNRAKPIAIIPDTLVDFDGMIGEIEARSSAARGAATYDPLADQQRRTSKEVKTQKLAVVCFAIFAILFGAMFCFGVNEEIHLRRYAREAVRVDAPIVRRWMVRVTPKLEYRFKDRAGVEHTREVMMTQPAWDALEKSPTVPVEYLTTDPSWNRPLMGEDVQTSFGGKFLLLSGGGTLAMSFLFVFALMGYDLKTEDGKTRLVRRGQVIREFGGQKKNDDPLAALAQKGTPSAVMLQQLEAPAVPLNVETTRTLPGGLLALGILCIVFGLIEAALTGVRAILWSRQFIALPDGRVIITAAQRWMHWWNGADAVAALLLIVTGILLLRRKLSGRTLGIGVALFQILSCLGTIVMMIVQMASTPAETGPGSMTVVTAQTASIIVQLISMVFPIVLLMILLRRKTAEALGPEVHVEAARDLSMV